MNILDLYCQALGQCINPQKSAYFFSPNTPLASKNILGEILGVNASDHPGKYLGMPMEDGQSKKEVLKFLKEKMVKKMSSWKQQMLSMAGREVLIKYHYCYPPLT